MTPTEAGELLILMQASWPKLAPDDVGARLWVEDLCECDADSALKTFRWLRDHEQFPPSWAAFLERYRVEARPSISEQIAIEGPPVPVRRGNGTYEAAKAAQREARVMERIENRPHHPQPMVEHFDALTPMLSYEEVYDEEGNPRFSVNADGWPA